MCKQPCPAGIRAHYSEVPQGDDDPSQPPQMDSTSGETGVPLLSAEQVALTVAAKFADVESGKPDTCAACSCLPLDALSGSWSIAFGEAAPSSTTLLKLAILVAVTVQNTAYCLIRRYSRGHLKEAYSSSAALLVMEIVKLLFSAQQLLISSAPSDVPPGSPLSKYAHLLRKSAKMAVPAIIYLIMNLLSFFALARIDASTFSIVAQMKVLSTALFSVAVLGRRLECRKWRALMTLTLGVVLISEQTRPVAAGGGAAALPFFEWLMGMTAVCVEVLLSGFACIYFEKVLKSADEKYSVWDRNFQLAFWSICIYLPLALYDNPTAPFAGWSWVASACSAMGALGGILVALSIKYTDSVMKTIATTGSIVLTAVLNAAFLDGPCNSAIVIGGLVVIVSVFNYSDSGAPRS